MEKFIQTASQNKTFMKNGTRQISSYEFHLFGTAIGPGRSDGQGFGQPPVNTGEDVVPSADRLSVAMVPSFFTSECGCASRIQRSCKITVRDMMQDQTKLLYSFISCYITRPTLINEDHHSMMPPFIKLIKLINHQLNSRQRCSLIGCDGGQVLIFQMFVIRFGYSFTVKAH